jgi:hypothetical protein
MTHALPPLPRVTHAIDVTVVSQEEASLGVAEFWSGGELIGFTRIEDGDLMLRIGPSRDGAAVVVGARGLAEALAEAHRLLALHSARACVRSTPANATRTTQAKGTK